MAEQKTKKRSHRLQEYRDLLEKLPNHIAELAEDKYQNYFSKNPRHPLLRGHMYRHKLKGCKVYKVAISDGYRALAFIEEIDGAEPIYLWYWIGSHEDYNGVVSRTLS